MTLNPLLIDRLVLTLAHFVWQGCLLAVLAWLCVEGLGIRSVHKRYALSLCLLAAGIVMPCVTFAIEEPEARPELTIHVPFAESVSPRADEATLPVANIDNGALPVIIPGPSNEATSLPSNINAFDSSFEADRQFEAAVPSIDAPAPALTWLQRNGQWFVLAWACGVAGLALRLILATASATVLRWRGRAVEADWQAEIDRLARLMNLRRSPSARLSRMVRQVCVVGLYRPVILFPASWASGVPADVLEAVIAHELAHIRRHDVWVIHLQRMVESLLFFHPAIWWISRQVSRHRELCCDADAAQVLGSPVKYATALEYVALKEYSGSQTLFMATLGGKKMELLERIQTVLGAVPTRPRRWQGSLAACLVLAGLLTAAAWLVLPGTTTSQADDNPVAVDAAAEQDVESADTSSQPLSEPASSARTADLEPSPLSPEEVAAMERLAAGAESDDTDTDTSSESDSTEQVVMTYAVAQFLTPVPGTEGEVTHESIDALKRLISTQVPADSWVDSEVPRIVYVPTTLSLVISQDQATHERIRQFLDDLDLLLGGVGEVEEISTPDESSVLETEDDSGSAEQPFADIRPMSPDEQREMILQLYQRYLQREPRDNEYAVIMRRLDRGQRFRDVEIDLLAGNEFYTRCEADDSTFIHELHREFFDRGANAPEQAYWLSRLEQHGGARREVAREFLEAVGGRRAATATELPTISPQDEYREFLLTPGIDESDLRLLPQPPTPGEVALENALDEITSLEADNTSLSDVMQMMSDSHDINIVVDEVALNEIGAHSDDPITVTIQDVTLRSALNIICEPLDIGYRIDGEVLMITSRDRLEGDPIVITYPVADIVQPAGSDPTPEVLRLRLQRLVDSIPLVIVPGRWSQVGGQGAIHSHPSTLSLVVRQTPAGHRQLASLLEVLRNSPRTDVLMMKPGEVVRQKYPVRLAAIAGHLSTVANITAISPVEFDITAVARGRTSIVVTDELGESRRIDVIVSESDADTAALLNVEEQIEQALDRRIELRVRQVPLNEALDMVSEQLGINIVVDEPGLNEYGVTSTDEVSLSLRNIPAKTVLELLLDPLRLDFVVRDEVVLVTNHAWAQGQLNAVAYDVSDLVGGDEESVEADLEELADLLRSTAAPESWQMVGGQGSIIVIPWRKTLVVTQSPARHEAVEAVLASLRKASQPVDP